MPPKYYNMGYKTHAFSVMYDVMNKTAQKWPNDSLSGLKT